MARQVRRRPTPSLSTATWFGIGCGAALGVGIIAALIVFGLVKSTPAPPPEATALSGSSPPPSAPSLEQQIRGVEQMVRRQGVAQVSLTIRQEELNSLIGQHSPGQVRNLKVYFGSGSIAATGEATWHGQRIPVTIRATAAASGGELQVQVSEVRLGRLGAPAAIKQQVQQDLQQGVRQLMGSNQIRVDSVSVSPGVMTVQGWVGQR